MKSFFFNQWQPLAELYHNIFGATGDELHQKLINPLILEWIGAYEGKKIVDLGCGNGYLLSMMAHKANSIIGLDASSEMIKYATENCSPFQNIKLYLANLEEPFELASESSDITLSIMVNQYIENTALFVKEVARTLKREGIFIMIIHHPAEMLIANINASLGQKHPKFLNTCDYLEQAVIRRSMFENKVIANYFHRPVEYYLRAFSQFLCLNEIKEIFDSRNNPRLLAIKWTLGK